MTFIVVNAASQALAHDVTGWYWSNATDHGTPLTIQDALYFADRLLEGPVSEARQVSRVRIVPDYHQRAAESI